MRYSLTHNIPRYPARPPCQATVQEDAGAGPRSFMALTIIKNQYCDPSDSSRCLQSTGYCFSARNLAVGRSCEDLETEDVADPV